MKNIILFCISFLFIQQSFCQKDSLCVGWGITLDGLNKSKMFLLYGRPYYDSRRRIIVQYKVTVDQPKEDGVVIVTTKRKSDSKIFYSIFCRIWAWEYVTTSAVPPTIIKFNNRGDITIQYSDGIKIFQRVVFVSSPGIISWHEIFIENPPTL